VDSDQAPGGPGWLDEAARLLRSDRRLGAVGTSGQERDGRAAWLGVAGLVVPRAVLVRAGTFDEGYDPAGCGGVDLSFQVREAGYELAWLPGSDLERRLPPGSGRDALRQTTAREVRRRLRAKWRHRPEYLASLGPDL
jgi:hypothetical protein